VRPQGVSGTAGQRIAAYPSVRDFSLRANIDYPMGYITFTQSAGELYVLLFEGLIANGGTVTCNAGQGLAP